MHKAPFEGKEYKICENIISRWFNDVYTQKNEQKNEN